MMLIEGGILLKNHVVIYDKILHHGFIQTIYENFKWFFFTYIVQAKIWKLVYLFDLSNWRNKNSFEMLSLDNILMNGHYLKNVKYHVCKKLIHVAIQFLHDCHLRWSGYLKSFIFNFFSFPALEIKKLVFVDKILWRFDIILQIWLIHLFFMKYSWLIFTRND